MQLKAITNPIAKLKAAPALRLSLVVSWLACPKLKSERFGDDDKVRPGQASGTTKPGDFEGANAVLTATQLFNAVTRTGSNFVSTVATEPSVKQQTNYFLANIGKVTSAQQLVNNSRLYNYVMNAFGLGDNLNEKALITKVLEGGTGPGNFAATLNDPRYTALASAFDFAANGATTTSSETTQQTTISNFYEQTVENNVGQQNQGAQMALYFKRMAPEITSPFNILGDKTLLNVFETAFNLPSTFSLENIDSQANTVSKLLNISQLQNPTFLQKFIERFTASYDAQNPTGGSTAPPTIALLLPQTQTTGISQSLLMSIANLKLGGS